MSEADAFDQLARDFFSVWFRFHPEAALQAGLGESGALLPTQSDDDQAALAGWLENLVVALEEFDYASLDPARRVDLELMFALARVEHRELLERDWRHRDPLRFLPLSLIHRLTLLHPDHMRDTLSGLFDAVPAHLRLAITQLKPMAALVPQVLVQAAIEAADDGRRYLRSLTRSRWLRHHCHGAGELETQAEAAAGALRRYAAALGSEILPLATRRAGCGGAHLRFLLRHHHLLDIDPIACTPLLDDLAEQGENQALSRGSAFSDPRPQPRAPLGDLLRAECDSIAARLKRELGLRLPPSPLRIARGPVCPRPGEERVDYVPDLINGEGVIYVPDRGNTIDAARGVGVDAIET
ncbi:MAG: DUF885 family protein, partial [Thiohalocapsa sp.]